MTLDLDFDPIAPMEVDGPVTRRAAEPAPKVTETARAVAVTGTAYIAKSDAEWGWSDLRDYILTEIEARHGAQVRDPKKEAGIIKAFMSRWGTEGAVRIARTAFEVHDGMWRGAPISINRFCLNSDQWFAGVIAKNF